MAQTVEVVYEDIVLNPLDEQRHRVLDCSKAKVILGWQPQYMIEMGVKKTTDW